MGSSPANTVVDHLERALEEAENDEAIFHIRQAIQHLGGDIAEE